MDPSKNHGNLKEHVERLFFMPNARRMNEIDCVLSMMGTKGENFVSNGIA